MTFQQPFNVLVTFALIVVLQGGSAAYANAQSTDQLQPEADVKVEEIIVTARRVREDIRDVPFTVNVVDADKIEQNRLASLNDVFLTMPGVEITSFNDSSGANVRIRGVGAINKTSRDDSSVVIYLDGVPQPIGYSTLGTVDMQTVEVLKGPQGTLFGRNSEAGAIQILTNPTVYETEASLRAEYGEENQRLVQGVFNTGLSDRVALRLAGSYEGDDNHIINPNDSQPITKPESIYLRAKLRWDINARVTLDLIGNLQRLRNVPFIYSLHPQVDPPEMDAPPGAIDDDRDIDQLTANLIAELGFVDFTSVTAWSDSENTSTGILYEGRIFLPQFGFVPANYGVVNNSFKREFFNQELRLHSKPDSKLFWVAGFHYYNDSSESASFDYEDPFFFPAVALNADINEREFDTTSAAIFGEFTWPLTEQLGFTAGVRHSWEEKEYKAVWAPNQFHPSPLELVELSQDLEDNYFTGRLALNYRMNEQFSFYGIYARGYKAGGFADRGANIVQGRQDLPYRASKVDSWELGFRSAFADGAVALNGALYLNDVRDDHIFTFNFFTQETAPENFDTETKGAELELDWQILESLSLQAGLNYTDAKIVGVPENSFARVPEGSRVPNSADWSGSVSLSHELPLSISGIAGARVRTDILYNYLDNRAADPANALFFDSYNLLNMRLGFGNEKWELYFWGDNLLDEEIYMSGIVFNNPASTIARGRRVGLGINIEF